MWIYEKCLQYPVQINSANPSLAQTIITKLGGSHGKLNASLNYLIQRYSMPFPEAKATLTDIGTEELAHLEIISSMVYQLTRGSSIQMMATDFPCLNQTEKDPFSIIQKNMADELGAIDAYDQILSICNDKDVNHVLQFLRQRDKIHYQRFSELLDIASKVTD